MRMGKTHNKLTAFKQIKNVGLDITNLTLDHVVYQASSSQDYDRLISVCFKLDNQIHEKIIGGRRVAIFKLYEPFIYQKYSISALELIEPKNGQVCDSAYQHAEFIAQKPFEKYGEEYPNINWDTSSMNRSKFSHLKLNFENGLTLKFLQKPIVELVSND